MTINSSALFQFFKYVVYVLLGMNIYWFFDEESTAAVLQFSNGVGAADLIEAFSATIDTAAWVVLLLMFELETYVLEDRQFTRPVTWSLHGLRALCYLFIVYAFYGYIQNMTFPLRDHGAGRSHRPLRAAAGSVVLGCNARRIRGHNCRQLCDILGHIRLLPVQGYGGCR